uniref:Uncharacterized protein n=1 Tax=Anguilla anguilla TaxID=7936 RepID=A0A0E9TCK8_ANGAN
MTMHYVTLHYIYLVGAFIQSYVQKCISWSLNNYKTQVQ